MNVGRMASDTIMAAAKAKVFVKASGRNNRPSAPTILNTGRKLTIVVAAAVMTALPTSRVALKTISKRFSSGEARSKCLRIFSQIIMPIATMAPIPITIPDKETIFASIWNTFIPMNVSRTARGSTIEITKELLKCITHNNITIIVTKISSSKAESKV